MPEQPHLWRIDGIEEGVARVEEDGERMITLPRHLLPAGAREGQVLRVTRTDSGKGSVALTIVVDDAATAAEADRSRAQTAAILAQSRKRDPGGNVSL
jgi:hypothetical protein